MSRCSCSENELRCFRSSCEWGLIRDGTDLYAEESEEEAEDASKYCEPRVHLPQRSLLDVSLEGSLIFYPLE